MKDKDAKQIEADFEILNDIVEKFVPDGERKDKIFEMFNEIGVNFLSSPASSKDEYHSSYIGGLFDHTMNVWSNLVSFNESMELGFSEEEMMIVSLFHDIGKAVAPNLKDPFYVPASDWKQKNGQRFEYDTKDYMVTRDRTMFVLQSFGIKLSFTEYQAIMLHDGYMVEGNRSYSMKECLLAFWLHVSDSYAARSEEKQNQTEEK